MTADADPILARLNLLPPRLRMAHLAALLRAPSALPMQGGRAE
jgi:hypothetical protein